MSGVRPPTATVRPRRCVHLFRVLLTLAPVVAASGGPAAD